MMLLRAAWLFNGSDPPQPDVELEIRDGKITSLRSGVAGVPSDPSAAGFAIIPGLLNCHTHLEFSSLRAPLQPLKRFADWIETVVQSRREETVPLVERLTGGLEESLSSGVTGLVEIATQAGADLTSQRAPRVRIDREILGLNPADIAARMETARAFVQQHRGASIGLSPHAPYSVHPQLYRELCELAASEKLPLTAHLAESAEEMQLLREGTGPLVELFTRWGVWQPREFPRGQRPLAFLRLLAQAPSAIIAHGNLLDDEEIDFLAAHPQLSVVYCPRTHAAMQSGEHPWRTMLSRGVNVILGTDSRASNPDVSIFHELKFLHQQHRDLTASRLLQLATSAAARALDWQAAGQVQTDGPATLVVVKLPAGGTAHPQQSLFAGEVQRVLVDGEWVSGKLSAS